MEFVQKFTLPDFRAKNFTPSISPNFNSFSDKNTKKWVKMEKFTSLTKILHRRRQWRQGQISPLHNPDHPKFFHLGGHLRHDDGDDLVDLVEPHRRDSWKLEKIPRWWGHVPFSQGELFTFQDNQPDRCSYKLDSNLSTISSAKSVFLRKPTFCGTWWACWATLPK